MQAMKT